MQGQQTHDGFLTHGVAEERGWLTPTKGSILFTWLLRASFAMVALVEY